MADFYPSYPPSLNPQQEEYLLSNAKDYSIAHGLAVRPPTSDALKAQDPAGLLATTAPITLFPSLFPKVCFDQAKSVAQAYNELYSGIASDEGWLTGIVEEYVFCSMIVLTG
jgi:glutathione synthase